jgi:hypothetical protein
MVLRENGDGASVSGEGEVRVRKIPSVVSRVRR